MPESEEIFYMVYNPNGGRAPMMKHSTLKKADEEAKRMARIHPGQNFFVLKAVHCWSVVAPEPVEIELAITEEELFSSAD